VAPAAILPSFQKIYAILTVLVGSSKRAMLSLCSALFVALSSVLFAFFCPFHGVFHGPITTFHGSFHGCLRKIEQTLSWIIFHVNIRTTFTSPGRAGYSQRSISHCRQLAALFEPNRQLL
jgi:hypothetical protein